MVENCSPVSCSAAAAKKGGGERYGWNGTQLVPLGCDRVRQTTLSSDSVYDAQSRLSIAIKGGDHAPNSGEVQDTGKWLGDKAKTEDETSTGSGSSEPNLRQNGKGGREKDENFSSDFRYEGN